MSTTTWVLIAVCITAAMVLFATILMKRRRTPYLKLDPDRLPSFDEGLETAAGLTESSVHYGNKAQVFQDGDAFDAMIADIQAAEHTVHMESFVWSDGKVADRFIEALNAKAGEGKAVRVLLDAVGASGATSAQLERMKQGGCELTIYCKPRYWNVRRFNHRTHRKLLIIDGTIGYAFGHGIDDRWSGHGEDADHWRDTALRMEGPVVHAMQSVFAQNWVEETKRVLAGPGNFCQVDPRGDVPAHVVSSASDDAVSSVAMLYTVAIAAARREVLIQNPYFAPGEGVVTLLCMMVKRGVKVHLMVPGQHTDSPVVRRAGCHLYADLLEGGVKLYEFEPTLIHQKIMVVDGIWSHVGSTNFDARSLALNEEVGVGVLDREIAAELARAFWEDRKRAYEWTYAEWRRRPLYSKILDRLAYAVHDQL